MGAASECESTHLERENQALSAMLNLAHEAILLTDRVARVVLGNQSAQELLDRRGAISLTDDGRLTVSGVKARSDLLTALAHCADEEGDPPATHVERVVVMRAQASPLLLSVHPVRSAGAHGSERYVAVIVTDPDSRSKVRSDALQVAFGLPPAEARLAEALNDGMTLRQFALSQKVSYETARAYIKRVLSRTGAKSQADLVRLMRNLR